MVIDWYCAGEYILTPLPPLWGGGKEFSPGKKIQEKREKKEKKGGEEETIWEKKRIKKGGKRKKGKKRGQNGLNGKNYFKRRIAIIISRVSGRKFER